MQTFYWLIEGELAGCSCPGADRLGSHRLNGEGDRVEVAARLDEDLGWLREHGIGALLTLTETPLPDEALARHNLLALHLPVRDLTAPTPAQFDQALGFIDRQRGSARRVAVHCLVGQGRTGTVLAAYLIRGGATSEEAVRMLRSLSPGAIGSQEQERALAAFADRRDWIV